MVNLKNILFYKKGAQGIGTLIIFIAMILVAAVAAGVLIQTASSLQSKSLDVGRQAQERLTSDIEVVQLLASNTSDGAINGSGIDSFQFIVRTGSGSTDIKFDDLLVKFDSPTGSQSLKYNATNTSGTQSSYGIVYQVKGNAHTDGYLSPGDLVEINFPYHLDALTEGETGSLRLISKNGAVKPVQITTPSAMTDVVTYLYP